MAVVIGVYVLSFVGAFVQLAREDRPRTAGRVAGVILLWFLVVGMGLSGLYSFMGHTFAADQVARGLGWPTGNPFQYEVAVANLTVGVLGILCYWVRGGFWTATVISTSVWLGGDAVVHVVEIVTAGNHSPGNAGIVLYLDVLTPALLIGLWIVHKLGSDQVGATQAERAPRVA